MAINSEKMVGICILYADDDNPVSLKTYIWQDVDCPYSLSRFEAFVQAFESQQNKKIHSFYRLKSPLYIQL